jgi:hypothetical protein
MLSFLSQEAVRIVIAAWEKRLQNYLIAGDA